MPRLESWPVPLTALNVLPLVISSVAVSSATSSAATVAFEVTLTV
jgi:hypothetical protein